MRYEIAALMAGLLVWPSCAAAQDARPGVVEGVVINQLTGEPLRRAEVRLAPATVMGGPGGGRGAAGMGGPGGGMGPGGGRGQALGMIMGGGGGGLAVLTDDQGRFRFEAVPPGEYRVVSSRTGFIAARRSGSAATISVSDGGRVSGLNYAMLPQGVLAGRVLDEEGEPVQGAQVQVMNRRMQRGLMNWIGMRGNATNDLGEFRIAGVQPGKVLLQITPPGARRGAPRVSGQTSAGPARGYVAMYYPGVLDPSQALPLDVKPGTELTNLDITLRRTEVFRITGRALDATGEPMQRFIVSATRMDQAGAGPAGFAGGARRDGTFEVANLPPGDYRVMVRRLAGGPQNQAAGSVVASVGNADLEGLVIQVSEGMTVTGRVEIQGQQPAASVSPRNLRVTLLPAETGMMMLGTRPGVPSEDGSFTMQGVTPGKYRVAPANAQGVYLAQVMLGGQDYFGKEIDLTGGVPGPVQLIYRTDGASVTGSVELPDAKPVTPPLAVVVPADPALRAAIQPKQAEVDETGSFSFDNLRPGEYLLWVFDDADLNELSDPDFLQLVMERAVKVRADAGQTASAKARLETWPLDY